MKGSRFSIVRKELQAKLLTMGKKNKLQNSKLLGLCHSILQIEFVRFAVVGVIATAIHYGIYLFLLWCHSPQKTGLSIYSNIAYTIGYLISFCCNMWLSARFTFHEKLTLKRGGGFALSHLINYGLHIVFLNLFLWFGIPNRWAPIPVYCIVVPINYLLVRTVFKSKLFSK